ncbi:MAG TPA: hypothetical protein VNO31_15020, partial [Umezawaea sp.]|nr:hypothetical protein [Umezawaea sp.]
ALDTWCLTYVVATWRAFAGARADVLGELISPTAAPNWIAILRGGSNGPSIAILCAAPARLKLPTPARSTSPGWRHTV